MPNCLVKAKNREKSRLRANEAVGVCMPNGAHCLFERLAQTRGTHEQVDRLRDRATISAKAWETVQALEGLGAAKE